MVHVAPDVVIQGEVVGATCCIFASECALCTFHHGGVAAFAPAHWKCWCNGGEQGWTSTPQKQIIKSQPRWTTNVQTNVPTDIFHSFGVKRIKEKQLGDEETVSKSLFSAPAGPQTPTCVSVAARDSKNGAAVGKEEMREWGSEESFVESERKEVWLSSHKFLDSNSLRTHPQTHTKQTLDFTKWLRKTNFTELSGKYFYMCKQNALQIFWHPNPFSRDMKKLDAPGTYYSLLFPACQI